MAVAVCLEDGLSGLRYGAVARRAGVPDRTIVYYFPHRGDLVSAAVEVLAQRLLTRLQGALGSEVLPPDEILARTWPVLMQADVGPLIRVWLELCVQASGGGQPYLDASRRLATGWLDWLAEHVEGPTPAARQAAAAVLLARLDGALLLDQIGLRKAADQAVLTEDAV